MKAFSALLLICENSPVDGAIDSRRKEAHYDVIIMVQKCISDDILSKRPQGSTLCKDTVLPVEGNPILSGHKMIILSP